MKKFSLLVCILLSLDLLGCAADGDLTEQREAFSSGKTAREQGQNAQAATLFGDAAKTSDATLRGQALLERGLALNELEHFKDSVESLLKATDLLSGEERAKAYFYTGVVEQKLGCWSQARIHLINAMRYTNDATFQATIDNQINITGYTLQIGSFLTRSEAERIAAKWQSKVENMRLKPARVSKSQNKFGEEVFLVNIGQFSTFMSAKARQNALEAQEAVVVPLRN